MGNPPRFTEFFGYSAQVSSPNEQPHWGHLTAAFADEVQQRFEEWLTSCEKEVAEYEYAIEQSGLIFLLSKSGFETLDEWLAKYPLDPKCERIVKRPIANWGPV